MSCLIEWIVGDECRALDDKEMIEGLGSGCSGCSAARPPDVTPAYVHPQIIGRTLALAPSEPVEILDREYAVETSSIYYSPPRRSWKRDGNGRAFRPPAIPTRGTRCVRGRRSHRLVIFPLCYGDGPASAAVFATACPSGSYPRGAGRARTRRASVQHHPRTARPAPDRAISLDTYVGPASAARLAGQIRRGDCEMIEAAMMFCDLHHSTALSNRSPAEHVLPLLDLSFDQVVPAVEPEGGQVLNFSATASSRSSRSLAAR